MRRGPDQGEVGRIRSADPNGPDGPTVACWEGRFVAVGPRAAVESALEAEGFPLARFARIDAAGGAVTPGLVDPHTHLLFAGTREDELVLRQQGASYLDILAAGGGILSTVAATRAASEGELLAHGRRWLEEMLGHGVTTVEAKSGYGLDLETELRLIEVAYRLGREGPVDVVPTWLGAHAVPPEFDDPDAYLEFALGEVLPEAVQVAEAADVFLERGAFDAGQARLYLEACRRAGLVLRLHADQFTEAGGVDLAIELGARSVDHLEATRDDGVRALSASDVTAVLLPIAALVLDRPQAPARALADAGAAIALATDFNPGSAFGESLPLACALACTQAGLAPAEALAACTVNAAHVLGRADRAGRLAPGYDADILLLDAPDWRYLAYHVSGGDAAIVVERGEIAWRR